MGIQSKEYSEVLGSSSEQPGKAIWRLWAERLRSRMRGLLALLERLKKKKKKANGVNSSLSM